MNFIVMVEDGAKWLPAIFTVEPTIPLDGLSRMSGVGGPLEDSTSIPAQNSI